MKMVIYKKFGIYHCTNEVNFYANIQNARQIQKLDDFENPFEIVKYYCKYFGAKPEDFKVVNMLYDAFNDRWYTTEELAEAIVKFGDDTYEEAMSYIENNLLTNNKGNTDICTYEDYLKNNNPFEE